VILADQGSTDGTRAIARRFSKVRVVENGSSDYDEGSRQRLLLTAAREIAGPRLLVTLDADEFLTPTWSESAEWRDALSAPPGTVLRFDWVNVLPDGRSGYIPREKVPFAFVDDGSEHAGARIHSTRVPAGNPELARSLNEVKVLHLQFTDWRRMKSKQRWYQCWEALHHTKKRPIQIYRQYHRMDAFPEAEIQALDPSWLARYRELGLDLVGGSSPEPFWWDREVLDWIIQHGPDRFEKLDIWDMPWPEVARELGWWCDPRLLSDPRGPLERWIHRWLAGTQDRVDAARTRWFQRLLILFGW
jgi:hypothetical protein